MERFSIEDDGRRIVLHGEDPAAGATTRAAVILAAYLGIAPIAPWIPFGPFVQAILLGMGLGACFPPIRTRVERFAFSRVDRSLSLRAADGGRFEVDADGRVRGTLRDVRLMRRFPTQPDSALIVYVVTDHGVLALTGGKDGEEARTVANALRATLGKPPLEHDEPVTRKAHQSVGAVLTMLASILILPFGSCIAKGLTFPNATPSQCFALSAGWLVAGLVLVGGSLLGAAPGWRADARARAKELFGVEC